MISIVQKNAVPAPCILSNDTFHVFSVPRVVDGAVEPPLAELLSPITDSNGHLFLHSISSPSTFLMLLGGFSGILYYHHLLRLVVLRLYTGTSC